MSESLTTITWQDVIFRDGRSSSKGKLQLDLLDDKEANPCRARISFPGSALESSEAAGENGLAAALAVLPLGTATLQRFRQAGGEVLQEVDGWDPDPIDDDLLEWARFSLELDLGLLVRPILSKLVGGPIPHEWGDVIFTLRHGETEFKMSASIDGYGPELGTEPEIAHDGFRFVERYAASRKNEMRSLYGEAAKLRLQAGNVTWPDTRKADSSLVAEVEKRRKLVEFRFHPPHEEGTIVVFPEGGLMDDWKYWPSLTEEQREAVHAATLNYIFENEQEMTELGLDVPWLKLLYQHPEDYK